MTHFVSLFLQNPQWNSEGFFHLQIRFLKIFNGIPSCFHLEIRVLKILDGITSCFHLQIRFLTRFLRNNFSVMAVSNKIMHTFVLSLCQMTKVL